MIVKRLTIDDAIDFKEIRLQALKNNPEAFASTYEAEVNKTIEEIKRKMPINNSFILGCYQEKELIGIVYLYHEERVKVRHKAFVRSMYVKPEYRGKGVGKLLLDE